MLNADFLRYRCQTAVIAPHSYRKKARQTFAHDASFALSLILGCFFIRRVPCSIAHPGSFFLSKLCLMPFLPALSKAGCLTLRVHVMTKTVDLYQVLFKCLVLHNRKQVLGPIWAHRSKVGLFEGQIKIILPLEPGRRE